MSPKPGAMIYTLKPEIHVPMSRTYLHSPKGVRAIEVQLYFSFQLSYLELLISHKKNKIRRDISVVWGDLDFEISRVDCKCLKRFYN